MKCLACGAELPMVLTVKCPICHAEIDINKTIAEDDSIDLKNINELKGLDGENAIEDDSDVFETVIEEEASANDDDTSIYHTFMEEQSNTIDEQTINEQTIEEELEQTFVEDVVEGKTNQEIEEELGSTFVEDEEIEKTLMLDADDVVMAEPDDDISQTIMEDDMNSESVAEDLADSIYDMQTLPDSPESVQLEDEDEIGDTFEDEIAATYVEDVDQDQIQRTITDLWSGNIGKDDQSTTSLKVDKDFDLGTIPDGILGQTGEDRPDQTFIDEEDSTTSGSSSLVVKSRIFRGVDLDAETKEQTDYEIIRVLGEGGMGTVYEANQTSIDRSVAIKTLKPSMAKSASNTEKFLSEAVVTGDLDHPNIVPIYDLGTNHLGEVFYSMLCVSGTPWDEIIREKSLSENIEIFMKVADAVAFAHSRGVIHRDLKPENTMLGDYGEVLVMDWGLAMTTSSFRKQSVKVQAGSIGGTPAYMSPEMAKGEVHHIDVKSDVYLLGAILYEIVTGKPPHYGKNVMKCLFAAGKNEIRKTEKSGELIKIALKAMATIPQDRYESVIRLQLAIREYLSHTESIALSSRALVDLERAEVTLEYEDFSRARFGFEEAQNLWDGNKKAKEGFQRASKQYAQCAFNKSDFELGLSLLDANDPQQSALHTQLVQGQKERDTRASRLKMMQWIGTGLAAAVLFISTGAFFWIRSEAQNARNAEQTALAEKNIADNARDKAVKAEKLALDEKRKADIAKEDAIKSEKKAVVAKEEALAEKKKADIAKEEALAEKKKADIAKEDAIKAEKIAVTEKKKADIAKEEALVEKKKADSAKEAAIKSEKKAVIAKEAAIQAEKVAVMERKKADIAKEAAIKAEKVAVMEKKKADISRLAAIKSEKVAVMERKKADIAKEAAIKSEKVAVMEKKKADVAKEAAIASQKIAVKEKKDKEYEAYIAQIGLAAAKIQENSFESAKDLLNSCKPELRNWEWGRLMHLCIQSSSVYTTKAPVDAVATSPDGKLIASGGWNGSAIIRNAETGQVVQQLKHQGLYVHAIVFSPNGKLLATGGNDRNSYLQVWDVASGKKLQTYKGHTDAISSVQFSNDGARLLTASFDQSARLWDVSSGKEIQKLIGHTWWVWSAAFQPSKNGKPETKIVTSSQDGTVIVWEDKQGDWTDIDKIKQSSSFREHQGPVYSATFSPNGKMIASGGNDRQMLLWNPDEIPKDNYKDIVAGKKREQTPFRRFEGHIKAIRSVSFSKDGNLLLTGSQDNTIKVWSVEQRTAITTFRGHAGGVRSCQFSPDGSWIVSGSHDSSTRIWKIANYEEIRLLQGRTLEGHHAGILAADYSPDGKKIITTSRDRTAKIFSFEDGSEEVTLSEGHAYLASTARFSADGKELFTAAVDDTVRLWDVASGTEIALLRKTGRNAAIALSTDGKWLVTGGEKKTAKIWNVNTLKQTSNKKENISPVSILSGHEAEISTIAISPDNKTIYTGDVNGHAILWNRSTGKELRRIEGHSRKIVAARFLQNGEKLLTASDDTSVGFWNVATGKEDKSRLFKHPESVISMAVSPDEKYLYTSCLDGKLRQWLITDPKTVSLIGHGDIEYNTVDVSDDGKLILAADSVSKTVRLYDLATGQEVASQPGTGTGNHFLDFKQQSGQLWSARFSPDSKHLLTIGGNEARLWNVKTAKEEISFSPHGVVAAGRFSPDGKMIVTASWDNSAKVWSTETGQSLIKLQGAHTSYINDALFSPDGKSILTASDDGTVKQWDLHSGKVTKTFSGHSAGVWKAVYTKDGTQIITASADKTARLWDVASGNELKQLNGHQWGVLCVDVISKNDVSDPGTGEQWVITGSQDYTARVWDVKTTQTKFILKGHTANVTSVAFSPDGSRILTASADNTAKLWDAKNGKEILTLSGHQREITSIKFSPDGKTVLTASRDGKAIVWLTSDWSQKATITTENNTVSK